LRTLNIYKTYYPNPPGGLQQAIRQICATTSRLEVKNTILTLSPNNLPRKIEMPEATVVRERSWAAPASCDIGGVAAVSTYLNLLKETDIVHYFHPWPFADVLNTLKKDDKPAVLTYVSDVVRQRVLGTLYYPLMWRTLQKMDVIVANCSAYVETSKVLSHPSIRDKVRVIPLGIDESLYPKEEDESILFRIGIVASEPYFLFLGALRYYKGIDTLLAAAKSLNAKIVIAGSGSQAASLKRQAVELGLKNVIFTGQVTDREKVTLTKNCLALVLPSHLRSEAYGMVLIEASMMNKPMITCEIGTGTSYINLHEKTGLVVEPGNVDEIREAMKTILNDVSLARKLGDNARVRYEQLFSGPALGIAYKSVYDEILR
jgi:glycosyltransferase involved in cell wall biosynthesis